MFFLLFCKNPKSIYNANKKRLTFARFFIIVYPLITRIFANSFRVNLRNS